MIIIKVIKPSFLHVKVWTFNLLSFEPLLKYREFNYFKWFFRKKKKAIYIYTFKHVTKCYCPISIDELRLKYVIRHQPFHEFDLF